MSVRGWNAVYALGLVLLVTVACKFSFTTANISELKISKEKSAGSTTSSFNASDTVYVVADVSNAPSKTKLKARLLFDNVQGQTSGAAVPGAETTIEMPGSGSGTFTFTPPGSGWPNGSYKVEVSLLNEDNEQKDQKTGTFSVTGGATTRTAPASPPANSTDETTDSDSSH